VCGQGRWVRVTHFSTSFSPRVSDVKSSARTLAASKLRQSLSDGEPVSNGRDDEVSGGGGSFCGQCLDTVRR